MPVLIHSTVCREKGTVYREKVLYIEKKVSHIEKKVLCSVNAIIQSFITRI